MPAFYLDGVQMNTVVSEWTEGLDSCNIVLGFLEKCPQLFSNINKTRVMDLSFEYFRLSLIWHYIAVQFKRNPSDRLKEMLFELHDRGLQLNKECDAMNFQLLANIT